MGYWSHKLRREAEVNVANYKPEATDPKPLPRRQSSEAKPKTKKKTAVKKKTTAKKAAAKK